jgi:D-2-hydroxyacid dehydrogenase (NADP+)
MAAMTNLLLALAMPEEVVARYRDPLRAHFPEIDLTFVDHRDKIAEHIATTDILLCFGAIMTEALLAQAARLKWVQVLGTGTDRIGDSPLLAPDVVVTNIPGKHGPPVSEAVLAFMLGLSRDLPRSVRAQDRRAWDRFPVRLLDGKTATVFGIGVIAAALGPRLKAMGMRTIGVSSAPRPVAGFDEMLPRSALREAARRCDHLILLTPHNAETDRIVDAAIIAAMKPGACLVNLGRGGTVDEDALLAALEGGHLGGGGI